MHRLPFFLSRLCRLRRDERAQDLIEYALLAAFLAVTYGAFWGPNYATQIARIFARLSFEITRITGV